jgi:hypothetical protein
LKLLVDDALDILLAGSGMEARQDGVYFWSIGIEPVAIRNMV